MIDEKKKSDGTFKVLGICFTIILVAIIAYMLFAREIIGVKDVGLCLFTIAVLDVLFYLGHKVVNKK